jgi:hypothetical protein
MARTTPYPISLSPEQALAEANDKFAGLRIRIAQGDEKVSPADVAEAEQAVRFAELQVETTEERKAHEAEQHRLAQIEQVRADLAVGGDFHAKASEVSRLYGEAVAAQRRFHQAAAAYQADLSETFDRLKALRPLPGDISLRNGIVVDGATWPVLIGPFLLEVAARAADGLLPAHELRGLQRVADVRLSSGAFGEPIYRMSALRAALGQDI